MPLRYWRQPLVLANVTASPLESEVVPDDCSLFAVLESGNRVSQLVKRQSGHARLLPRSIQARTLLGTV